MISKARNHAHGHPRFSIPQPHHLISRAPPPSHSNPSILNYVVRDSQTTRSKVDLFFLHLHLRTAPTTAWRPPSRDENRLTRRENLRLARRPCPTIVRRSCESFESFGRQRKSKRFPCALLLSRTVRMAMTVSSKGDDGWEDPATGSSRRLDLARLTTAPGKSQPSKKTPKPRTCACAGLTAPASWQSNKHPSRLHTGRPAPQLSFSAFVSHPSTRT